MNEMDLVYSYTRKQALDDGILLDITTMAKEAGFNFPVAVTSTVYEKYLNPSKKLENYGQSFDGRCWDMVMMLLFAIRRNGGEDSEIRFQVLFLMDVDSEPELVDLKAVIGPGDEGEPVITVMFPYED